MKICRYCEQEYSGTGKAFCSRKCMGLQYRKDAEPLKQKRARVCTWCNIDFIMPHQSGKANRGEIKAGLFCSRKCRWALVKHNNSNGNRCKIYIRECAVCDRLFTGRVPSIKYCSDECMTVRNLEQLRKKYKDEWQQPEPFECGECGVIVVLEYGDTNRRYCSSLCADRSTNRNAYHRRKARRASGKREAIYRAYICSRDKWRCHICGKKVNGKLKNPHPKSATLDHVIPLAVGGTHEKKNIKLAHMICNATKGAGAIERGEQLMLIG